MIQPQTHLQKKVTNPKQPAATNPTTAMVLLAQRHNPVQIKNINTFHQTMNRVRALGLPAYARARIVKSLFSAGLYGDLRQKSSR
eukprot:1945908-Amphidinium_carterae.1